MKKRLSALLLSSLISISSAYADSDPHSVEVYLGYSFNKDYDVTIDKDDGSSTTIKSDYDTKPTKFPPFYSIRYGYWNNNSAWEVEHIHHKIYLDTLPSDVQHFEITDGYNLFTINRAWNIDDTIYRVGLGTVITHPQITVDGVETYTKGGQAIPKIWSDGYHWSGYSMLAGVQKRYYVTEKTYITAEAKLIHAWTKIPLENGSVEVPNTSLQLMIGYGGLF